MKKPVKTSQPRTGAGSQNTHHTVDPAAKAARDGTRFVVRDRDWKHVFGADLNHADAVALKEATASSGRSKTVRVEEMPTDPALLVTCLQLAMDGNGATDAIAGDLEKARAALAAAGIPEPTRPPAAPPRAMPATHRPAPSRPARPNDALIDALVAGGDIADDRASPPSGTPGAADDRGSAEPDADREAFIEMHAEQLTTSLGIDIKADAARRPRMIGMVRELVADYEQVSEERFDDEVGGRWDAKRAAFLEKWAKLVTPNGQDPVNSVPHVAVIIDDHDAQTHAAALDSEPMSDLL